MAPAPCMRVHDIAQIMGRGMRLRCPRCGEAPLFRGAFTMHERCPRCGLVLEREQGYYVGAIVVSGLSHAYGERRALTNVDLRIARGEMFGVLGPNGGGKTTLFKILATLVPPQTGGVTIFGDDVAEDPFAVRARLGVVFQHP